jgi:hypothetical protein
MNYSSGAIHQVWELFRTAKTICSWSNAAVPANVKSSHEEGIVIAPRAAAPAAAALVQGFDAGETFQSPHFLS